MVHYSELKICQGINNDLILISNDYIHDNSREYVEVGRVTRGSAFVVVDVKTSGTRGTNPANVFYVKEDEISYRVYCHCQQCRSQQVYEFGNLGGDNNDFRNVFTCSPACGLTRLSIQAIFWSSWACMWNDTSPREKPMISRPLRSKIYHCFLSHNWGIGGRNHEIVRIVNERLKARGIRTWVDEEQIQVNIRPDINRGMANCAVFLAFVTRDYQEKLQLPTEVDYCAYEFANSGQLFPYRRLPIVLESEMLDPSQWRGPLRELSDVLVIDMSQVNNNICLLSMKCELLVDRIEGLVRDL